VWRDREGAVCAWARSADGDRWMHVPGVASYRFGLDGSAVTAIPDPSAGSELVISGYERTVLPMVVQLAGREVLHASAVLTGQGVVAFCGVSTTGKSTIAHAFSQRGYGLWADDAVAFDTMEGVVSPVPLPFQLQLRPRSNLDRGRDTAVDVPDVAAPDAGRPFAAVCVLERAPSGQPADAARVRRLPPTAAFPAVLAHAYCYSLEDVERNRRMIDHYLDMCARVPTFSVVFRAGFEHLPVVLDEVEQAVGMAPTPTP
jgi:hypothetical protein